MTKDQVALPLAIVGVSIAGALAGTWAVLMPEKLGLALAGGLTVPVLWGLLELAAKDGKASIRTAVAAGAAIIALFLGLRVAQALQWLGPDEGKLWATLAVAAGTLLVVAQVVRCHFRGKNA